MCICFVWQFCQLFRRTTLPNLLTKKSPVKFAVSVEEQNRILLVADPVEPVATLAGTESLRLTGTTVPISHSATLDERHGYFNS